MAGLNMIREYLVGLGYKVDVPSAQLATRSLSEVESAVGKFVDSSVVKFAKAGTATAAFFATASIAIAKFTQDVGQADLRNQMMARRLWMNTDAAVAYQKSLDALGASLQDLYLSPELMQRFVALRQETGQLAPPTDFSQVMHGVRDVTFEFQRMRLEASYATYWIGYHLAKDLAGPGGELRDTLSSINDQITKHMPEWTANVAEVLAKVIGIGRSMVWGIQETISGVRDLITEMPHLAAAFGIVAAVGLMVASPFIAATAAVAGLLLLLDDYNRYEHGKDSALPALWKQVDQWRDSLGNNQSIKDFKATLEDTAATVGKLALALASAVVNLAKFTAAFDAWYKNSTGLDAFEAVIGAFSRFFDTVAHGIALLVDFFRLREAIGTGDWAAVQKELSNTTGDLSAIGNNFLYEPPAAKATRQQQASRARSTEKLRDWAGVLGTPLAPNFQFSPVPPSAGSGGGGSTELHLENRPTYYIYGASDAAQTAKLVEERNAGLLMRALQGVTV